MIGRRLFRLLWPNARERYTPAEIRNAYVDVFTSPKGQVVLAHLISVCGVLGPTYTPGDPHETSHKEGRRDVVVGILRMVNADPSDLLDQLEKEDDDSE